jgi:hypothetical protein
MQITVAGRWHDRRADARLAYPNGLVPSPAQNELLVVLARLLQVVRLGCMPRFGGGHSSNCSEGCQSRMAWRWMSREILAWCTQDFVPCGCLVH